MRRSGRVVNSFRTDIRRETFLHECATRCGLSVSATFDVELYTHEGASALSELWRERMFEIAVLWRDVGSDMVFPAEKLQAYEAKGTLLERLDKLSGRGAKRRRDIENLRPKMG
eukprot:6473828-Amphidinium_carterae.1